MSFLLPISKNNNAAACIQSVDYSHFAFPNPVNAVPSFQFFPIQTVKLAVFNFDKQIVNSFPFFWR